MHAIEKILARAAGREIVQTGEIVNCKVDFAEINDLYLQTVRSFYEMGGEKVWDASKLAFVFDHYAPPPTIQTANIHREMRAFKMAQSLTHHFDIHKGVCHQVMPEAGVVWPGMILVATDSHTTTHGAFGAFGTGVGATDLATIMMSGELWFRVPEIINIVIEGTLPAGVFAKDVILHIIGALKADVAVYKAVEFSGTYVDALSVADRMTICNMAVEMGAKTAYMKPNETVLNYVKARTAQAFTLDETDADFMYNAVYHFDISALKPQVAMPHSVDNVCDLEAIAGPKAERIKVDQAFIGSCTGGRLEDIAAAYHVLKDAKVNANTRLVIIPASAEVYQNAIEMGYVTALIDAGATFAAPGCGPCLGTHAGLIAAGEVCMSATNRNFPGRMGSTEGRIYLASPASVAASARNGFISDPSEFWIRRPKHA